MAEIAYPFVYSENLNGLEINSRGLKQQKKFNDEKKYEMTWDNADEAALAQATTEGTNIRNSDFYVAPVYSGCIDDPPCPWDKTGNNDLKESNLMPVILPRETGTTYQVKAYEREDNGTISYALKGVIANYLEDQSRLPANKRADFTFFEYSGKIEFTGTAIIIVEKIQAGTVQSTYTYLFNLIDPLR
jgi:hypothetical protein